MWIWHKLELDKEHCSWKKVDETHHLVDEFVCAIIREVKGCCVHMRMSLVISN